MASKAAIEAKHTPGPWRAEDARDGYEIVSSSPRLSGTVAVLSARRSVTGAADARLIAAAPDMLEALKSALASIENTLRSRGYSDGESTDKWSGEVRIEVATRAKLRAAIAKACA